MEPFVLVIFGDTSNLTQIKLFPALYDLAKANLLPEEFRIVGVSRKDQTEKESFDFIYTAIHKKNVHHTHDIDENVFNKLAQKYTHFKGDVTKANFFSNLKKHLSEKHKLDSGKANFIFYLATYPNLYKSILENLKFVDMTNQKSGWKRIIVEKPIGTDLKSSRVLNNLILKYFTEDQIYRLDHYLGKETMQNILTFRFGNGVFEHLMNNKHVEHIQVTESEDIGIGERGVYFDLVGGLKDVGQNHILQMIALNIMDTPKNFSNQEVTRERIKAIRSLKPLRDKVVFGQYEGYRKEKNVNPNSQKDTFFAFKTIVKRGKFNGVPIYARFGKRLPRYVTEVSIIFKSPPDKIFRHIDKTLDQNVLTYRIFPNEGVILSILTKIPGHNWQIEKKYMQYCYDKRSNYDSELNTLPDPYERLLVDVVKGDQTFFIDKPEVEAQWKFIDPLVDDNRKVHEYKINSWGPLEANKLIEEDGFKWIEPPVDVCMI